MKTKINWGQVSGKRRIPTHFLKNPEKKLVDFLAPKVPLFISANQLTLTAIPLGLLVLSTGYLARQNRLWFLANALLVFLRYLADCLDGETGRRRKSGFIKWGFYVDHFLDFVFTICIISSYLLYLPQNKFVLMLILGTIAAHYLNESLICINFGCYETSGYLGIGPTEAVLGTIIFSLLLAFFPPTFSRPVLMFFWAITTLGLTIKFYLTQKNLHDQESSKNKKKK